VLYLRHRLQKGFLTRDQTPKEEEMATMSDYFKQLENYVDLEGDIIKATKIHKVLKAIIKLNSIPKEEDFKFKQRSNELLNRWSAALSSDMETSLQAPTAPAPATNGVNHEEKLASKPDEPAASEAPVASTGSATEDVPGKDADGDVSMAGAKGEAPVAAPTATEAVAEPTATA
jgi:hypothetical protein